MKEYKYRHELKFKISNSAAEVLKQKSSLILGKDKNAYYEDGSYLIKSLYFDDRDSSSYYEKMDGVLYRKKYRIRMYNDVDTFIRLEKKMKHNNFTAKEQMLISKGIYSKILNGKLLDCYRKSYAKPLFKKMLEKDPELSSLISLLPD